MRLPRLLAPFLLLALILLAACEDEGGPSASPEPTPSPTVQPSPTPVVASPCADRLLAEEALATLPQLKEAGGRIAYVCEGQVWTMRPDGSDQRRLTEPTSIDFDQVSLYRVPEDQPPDAKEIAELEGQMDSWPLWLPDGRIVFASIRDPLALSAAAGLEQRRPFVGASELYMVNADGSGLTRLTDYNLTPGSYPAPGFPLEPASCEVPSFCFAGLIALTPRAASPDGTAIAVGVVEIRFTECCGFAALFDPASRELEGVALTAGEPEGGDVLGFSWSPDGRLAAAVSLRGSTLPGPFLYQLAVRDLETDEETILVEAGEEMSLAVLEGPSWSPLGSPIAFCARPDFNEPYAVYTIDASGGEPVALAALEPPTDESQPQRCNPSWSPDGNYLAVDSGDGAVLIIDAESGDSAKLSLGGQPSWGPAE